MKFLANVLPYLLAFPACMPASSPSRIVPTAEPYVRVTSDGRVLVDLAVQGNVQRRAGENGGPTAVLSRGTQEVARTPMEVHDGAHGNFATVTLSGSKPLPVGHYVVSIGDESQAPLATASFDVVRERCIGGESDRTHLAVSPRILMDRGKAHVWPARWVLHDTKAAWVASWSDSAGVVTKTTGRENPHLGQALEEIEARGVGNVLCPLAFDDESYEVPASLLARPGSYALRLLRQGSEPLEVAFTVTSSTELQGSGPSKTALAADNARRDWIPLAAKSFTPTNEQQAALAKVPEERPNAVAVTPTGEAVANPLRVSPQEIRALLREPALLDQRIAFNKQVNVHQASLEVRRIQGETTHERELRVRAADGELRTSEDSDLRARRANAKKLQQALETKFREIGAPPWRRDEMPN